MNAMLFCFFFAANQTALAFMVHGAVARIAFQTPSVLVVKGMMRVEEGHTRWGHIVAIRCFGFNMLLSTQKAACISTNGFYVYFVCCGFVDISKIVKLSIHQG